MKTNFITRISTGLLAAIIILSVSLAERSVHADEVKARQTAAQATAPETPTRCDHTAALREIDLKVALQQYEKILTELEDTRLQLLVGPRKNEISQQQIAEWREARQSKVSLLAQLYTEYRKKIEALTAEGHPPSTSPALLP